MVKYTNDCVIYARVSTQDKQEYDRQVDDLKRLAQFKQLNVVEAFGEKISGTIKANERPAFMNMLRYIEENDIHHVLVSELSRLGRRMRDTINTVQDFTDKKICVHILQDTLSTLDKNFKENKFTGLIINVLIGFADIERDTFAERSKSGIRFNVKNGGSGTGIIKPFGYKKVGKRLFIDEHESVIVRLIFQKYLEGYGSQQIANLLNEKGVKTKYNTLFNEDRIIKTRSGGFKKAGSYIWRDATIINILRNTIYMGKRNHKGEIFDIDAVIDPETFELAQVRRKEKYNKKGSKVKFENIFKEKIKCPVCGSGYFLHRRSDLSDNAYKCLSKRLKDIKCDNVSVNIDKLNNAVYQTLKDTFKFQSNIDKKLSSKSVTIKDTISIVEAEKNQLIGNINIRKSRQKKLLESYLDNQINKQMFTETNSEIALEIIKLEDKVKEKEKEIYSREILLQTLSTQKNRNLENVEIFKRYIKDYITFIKVHNVTDLVNMGEIGKHFTTKNDVITLVEVKSELIDSYNTFLIGRYSDNLIHIDLNDTEDLDKKIPYLQDYHISKIGDSITI